MSPPRHPHTLVAHRHADGEPVLSMRRDPVMYCTACDRTIIIVPKYGVAPEDCTAGPAPTAHARLMFDDEL